MQDYIKPARSLHVSSTNNGLMKLKNIQQIDPANFLNDFDAIPNSQNPPLLMQQTERKKEFQKTKYRESLILPKLDSKFIKDNPETTYFFFEKKQKNHPPNPKPYAISLLQPNEETVINPLKEQEQLLTKKKRVEFNTALEIVDISGRVSTEMIVPEPIRFKKNRLSRLRTLEC